FVSHALAEARLGHADAARRKVIDLGHLIVLETGKMDEEGSPIRGPIKLYAATLADVFLGQEVDALRRLEEAGPSFQRDGDYFFLAGRAYAVAAEEVRPRDATRADRYTERAIDLLQQALELDYGFTLIAR